MKKILMIAPASYPVFGAEAIVNIKLLKALTNNTGFEIDLISKKSKWSDYPSDNISELGVKVNSINIIEVDNNISLKTIILHLKSLFFFKSVFRGCHWAIESLNIIKKLVSIRNYEYVLTKNAPSFLLGNYLKQKFGIKWIATWNDPYPTIKYPFPYGKGRDAKMGLLDNLQLKVMKNADMHIFPNDRLRRFMLSYMNIPLERTIVIPHVVNNNENHLSTPNKNQTLRFIHSGNILPPRSPKTLIEAIDQIEEKILSDIRISIIGVTRRCDFENSGNIEKAFELLPPVSYSESLKILKDYNIAIIIESPCDEGIFLPTKVSDFLQAGIPIWAISPRTGVLNDLYRNGNIPYFSDVEDIESIKKTLEKIYTDFKSNSICQNKIPPAFTEEAIIAQYNSL